MKKIISKTARNGKDAEFYDLGGMFQHTRDAIAGARMCKAMITAVELEVLPGSAIGKACAKVTRLAEETEAAAKALELILQSQSEGIAKAGRSGKDTGRKGLMERFNAARFTSPEVDAFLKNYGYRGRARRVCDLPSKILTLMLCSKGNAN
jgi:hypothetical protein